MTSPRVILASTSLFRRDLLARLRIPFESATPRFDEIVPPRGAIPAESVRSYVRQNARGKAASLREAYPQSLLLASDQLAECEGQVLAKPGTEEKAVEQLLFLRGKEHRLQTAVVLLEAGTGRIEEEVVTSVLRMRILSESRLRRYVQLESPLHSAGSYLSEGLGITLFEAIGGSDPTAVIGLPLITVVRLLERFEIDPLGEPTT
jgi:septum formation protein